MTATLSQIRAGLEVRLKSISGLRASAYWPDTVNPPAAIVRPMDGQFNIAMGDPGFQSLSFEIVLAIAAMGKGLARGQKLLDDYLDVEGSLSIKAAIEGDQTLGGVVTTLDVTGWNSYGSLSIGDIEYIGATFQVSVWP